MTVGAPPLSGQTLRPPTAARAPLGDGPVDRATSLPPKPVAGMSEGRASGVFAELIGAAPVGFKADVAVGDAAVRFDGRAIVAPTFQAVPGVAADRLARENSAASTGAAIAPRPLDRWAELLAEQLAAPHRAISPTAGNTTVGEIIPAGPTATLRKSLPAAVATRPTAGASGEDRVRIASSRPSAARPVALAPGVTARATVFADEIRIVIHGTMLDDTEVGALVRAVEDLLAGTPLGARDVRVVATRRR